MIKVKYPDLILMEFFFELHSSIAMPENILESFRYTGYRWMERTFAFKKLSKPVYAEDITSGILKTENRTLPTDEDEERALKRYIEKIVVNMVMKV